jgi:hypothetical protein
VRKGTVWCLGHGLSGVFVGLFPVLAFGVEHRQTGVRRGIARILDEDGVKLPDRLVGPFLPHEQQGAL